MTRARPSRRQNIVAPLNFIEVLKLHHLLRRAEFAADDWDEPHRSQVIAEAGRARATVLAHLEELVAAMEERDRALTVGDRNVPFQNTAAALVAMVDDNPERRARAVACVARAELLRDEREKHR